MAHKTLINGTAYNVVSGTSMIDGAQYNIVGGKTLIDGTGYNINFALPKTAMLYWDGSLVFQDGDDVAPGKNLRLSFTDFENVHIPPWEKGYLVGLQTDFTSVSFDTEISPINISDWFSYASNLFNINNFGNLNMNNTIAMDYTF